MGAYIDVIEKISTKFNAMTFEERNKSAEYKLGTQLITIEQIKDKLIKNHKKQLKELSDWEKDLVCYWEKEFNKQSNGGNVIKQIAVTDLLPLMDKIKKHIEQTEVDIDCDYKIRSLDELILDGRMPKIYDEICEFIKTLEGM